MELIQQPVDNDTNLPASICQFLSFRLAGEEYAVDIHRVQEIRSWEPVSRVPNVPAYEKGVINLRGEIVPIMDLREKFGLPHPPYSAFTVVIVLQAGVRIMGIIVDAVSNVIDIEPDSIQKAPEFGAKIGLEYITGLLSDGNNMVVLLDVDRLLQLDALDDQPFKTAQTTALNTDD